MHIEITILEIGNLKSVLKKENLKSAAGSATATDDFEGGGHCFSLKRFRGVGVAKMSPKFGGEAGKEISLDSQASKNDIKKIRKKKSP